jgi:hypothetical protein
VLWANYAKAGSDGSDAEISDEALFDLLTDSGSKVGIFADQNPQTGEQMLLINADYIRTGQLTFGNKGQYYIAPCVTEGDYLKLPGLTVASGGTSLSFGDGNFSITSEGKALLFEIGVGTSSIGANYIHSMKLSATEDIEFKRGVSLTDALDCILTRLNDLDHRGTTMGHDYVGGVCIQCSKGGSGGGTNTCAHTSDSIEYEFDENEHWMTCNKCGERYNVGSHLYDPDTNYWESNDTQHWRICNECQVPYDHADHTFDENGICTECKYQRQADVHTHNLQHWAYKAPTCTESGHNECWYCHDCEEYFLDAKASISANYFNDIEIFQLGHDFPATYTNLGNGYHALVCDRCGEYKEGSYHSASDPDAGCTICPK